MVWESVGTFFRRVKDHIIPSPRNVYRPHMLRKPWLVFFLAIILTAEGVFVADLLTRQGAFNFLAAVLPGEVIALTNAERSLNSVGTLAENAALDAAAQAKADDMAAKGYFSHVSPDGTEPWAWVSAAGYTYRAAGENLAVRFVDSRDVVEAWMESPSHRANIVKPVYQDIGVGVAQGTFQGEPATFVVQYFGAPQGVASAPASSGVSLASAVAAGAGSGAPQVQGAETEAEATSAPVAAPVSAIAPQQDTPWTSFARELARGDVRPSAAVLWVLGGVATLLVVGLALAFFIHIQIQPTDMLVSGAVLAVVALSFFALTFKTSFGSFALPGEHTQTAAVFGALPSTGGFIDSTAAAVYP